MRLASRFLCCPLVTLLELTVASLLLLLLGGVAVATSKQFFDTLLLGSERCCFSKRPWGVTISKS